jgi:hypothetical protein
MRLHHRPQHRRPARKLRLIIATAAATLAAATALTYSASAASAASAAIGSDLQLSITNVQTATGGATAQLTIFNAGPDTLSPNARMTLVIDVPNSISRISRPQSCTEGIGTIGRRVCQMPYSEANLRPGESRVFEAQFVGTWQSGDQIVFSMPVSVGLNDPNLFNLATAPLP